MTLHEILLVIAGICLVANLIPNFLTMNDCYGSTRAVICSWISLFLITISFLAFLYIGKPTWFIILLGCSSVLTALRASVHTGQWLDNRAALKDIN